MSLLIANKLSRFRRDLKSALIGTDADYTSVSLKRALFLLAIPMVLEMVMESIFALADIFFVSRLGADAIAVVGITESMMTIIYALGIGLSMATTAIVSRRMGEKNPDEASYVVFQAIFIGFIISMIIGIPGFIYAENLLKSMGSSQAMISQGADYTAIMLGGNFIIVWLFIINAVFRSSGDPAISMRVLIFANLLNIVLDPCLIFGLGPFPELGLKGAAIATNIGRGAAVVYQLCLLFNGKNRIKLTRKHIKIRLSILFEIVRLSAGGVAQNIIATSSWVIMIRLLSVFGSQIVAGYTIAIRIIVFALLPSWGLSNAASTLVGQNLGAKRPDRAEKSVWITAFINAAFMAFVGSLLIIFAEYFIRFFSNDFEVIYYGKKCLYFIVSGFVFYAFGMVMVQAFNGAGDTKTPTIINIFCFWLLEVPLAYLFSIHFDMKENGVYTAILIAESLLAIIGIIVFRRGKWKLVRV
ncbi:MAG: MATE family efflux transporter [Bacteroidota bacterium]